MLNIGIDPLGEILGGTSDFKITNQLLGNSTGFHTHRLTMELNRNGSTDLHALGHSEESA